MFTLFVSLLFSVPACFRTRAVLQAEILALRHQLLVLRRFENGHRVRLRSTDRLFWVWLSKLWTDWRSALIIVKPETVIGWHRQGFRLYWKWKSRHPAGCPSVSSEVRDLIRRMSLSNPYWGAPRIHGELLKLGIHVSQATVAKYMDPAPEAAIAALAHVSEEPHAMFSLCRFLRGSDDHVPGSVRLRDSLL